MVNIRWCPNLRCIQVWTFYEVFKYQSLTWDIWNYVRKVSICELYSDILLELPDFFYGKLKDQKHVVISIYRIFLTRFGYYCNYYMVIWKKKFELSLEENWIFHPSPTLGDTMEHMSLNIISLQFFCIFLGYTQFKL